MLFVTHMKKPPEDRDRMRENGALSTGAGNGA